MRSRDRIFSRFGQKHNDVRTGSLRRDSGKFNARDERTRACILTAVWNRGSSFLQTIRDIISWWKRIIVNIELWWNRVKEQHWSASIAIDKDVKFEDRRISRFFRATIYFVPIIYLLVNWHIAKECVRSIYFLNIVLCGTLWPVLARAI